MSDPTLFCARCGQPARPTEFGHVHIGLSSHPVFGPVPEDQVEPDEPEQEQAQEPAAEPELAEVGADA